jgi:hypothetical protein
MRFFFLFIRNITDPRHQRKADAKKGFAERVPGAGFSPHLCHKNAAITKKIQQCINMYKIDYDPHTCRKRGSG